MYEAPPPASFRSFSLVALMTAAVAAAALVAPAPAQQLATPPRDPLANDRVVVVLASSLAEQAETLDVATAFPQDSVMRAALQQYGAHAIYREFRTVGAPIRDPALFHSLGMHRHYVIEIAPQEDVLAAVRAFAASPSVESARPDAIGTLLSTPNDPLFPQQWDARQTSDADIDADLAWDITTGDPNVVVAVIDTGADLNHPDLAGGLVPGYDFYNNDPIPQDDHGHGTSCSGIVAARGNNGIAIAGVAYTCKVMPVKTINSSGFGTQVQTAAGINFAANNGAKVISMSLGWGSSDAGMSAALAYAAGLDVISIAASGNGNSNFIYFPASDPNCMAVGATSPCDERKNPSSCDGESFWGSSYGAQLDVCAPGVLIRTLALGGGTTNSFNGTSSACPHVAGIAALVRSVDPGLTQAQVQNILRTTAEDQVGPPNEDAPGFDIFFGWGRVNAHRAVLAAMGSTTFCFGDGSGTPPPCGNAGPPDSGARNSTGSGALLNVSGTNSLGQDDLVLRASGLPLNKPGLMLVGAAKANGGNGVTFNDGLLCVATGGVGIFRFPAGNSGASGVLVQGPGIGAYACGHFPASACFQPGQTWNFQAWYRDQGGPCATSANLSNAIGVTFRP